MPPGGPPPQGPFPPPHDPGWGPPPHPPSVPGPGSAPYDPFGNPFAAHAPPASHPPAASGGYPPPDNFAPGGHQPVGPGPGGYGQVGYPPAGPAAGNFAPGHQPGGYQAPGHQPVGHQPVGHQPVGAGPGGYGAAGYGPVVIDIGQTAGRQAVIGAVVSGAVGAIALWAGLAGQVEGGGEGVAIVIGGLFLLPVVLVVLFSKQVFRPRKLVFEAAGVRWDDPQGAPWAVPWNELGAVSVSKHTRMRTPMDASDAIARAATDKMLGERALIRLDLFPFPHDGHFGERHPHMAHLWGRQGVAGGYRLPLGSKADLVPVMDQALRQFAPGIYQGVVATEGVMGLT